MYRIVRVTDFRMLSSTCLAKQEQLGVGYIFNVLKTREEGGGDYLLELPPNCGGHLSSSDVPAWWVTPEYCKAGYKSGQRWVHRSSGKDMMLVELIEDNIAAARVIQVMSNSCYWKVGEVIPEPTIESVPSVWTWLRGQDRP